MTQNSLEFMVSEKNFENMRKQSSDAFNMNIMQAFQGEIPNFAEQLNNYKGILAESLKEDNPELADKIANYQLKPSDIVEAFNDYISECFAERNELADESIESTEIINNEFSE